MVVIITIKLLPTHLSVIVQSNSSSTIFLLLVQWISALLEWQYCVERNPRFVSWPTLTIIIHASHVVDLHTICGVLTFLI